MTICYREPATAIGYKPAEAALSVSLAWHWAEVWLAESTLDSFPGLRCGGSRILWFSPRVHPPTADPAGHVIDLVNDQLPDISISEEDKKKNLALLEEAKSVSERFLTRRGRKSRNGPGDSPSGRMYRWLP